MKLNGNWVKTPMSSAILSASYLTDLHKLITSFTSTPTHTLLWHLKVRCSRNFTSLEIGLNLHMSVYVCCTFLWRIKNTDYVCYALVLPTRTDTNRVSFKLHRQAKSYEVCVRLDVPFKSVWIWILFCVQTLRHCCTSAHINTHIHLQCCK